MIPRSRYSRIWGRDVASDTGRDIEEAGNAFIDVVMPELERLQARISELYGEDCTVWLDWRWEPSRRAGVSRGSSA